MVRRLFARQGLNKNDFNIVTLDDEIRVDQRCIDMLRRFVMSDNFKATYDLSDESYAEVAEGDVALLKLGNKLMRQALFAEKTIPEKSDAWQKRVEERKEVWEARAKAEIEARNAKAERQMRDETTGGAEI